LKEDVRVHFEPDMEEGYNPDRIYRKGKFKCKKLWNSSTGKLRNKIFLENELNQVKSTSLLLVNEANYK